MSSISAGLAVGCSVGVGDDVELDHPVDVFVFGRPWEGGDRVAEHEAAVESGAQIRGLGEGVRFAGQGAVDDREEVVEGVDALVLSDGTVGDGDWGRPRGFWP